MESRDLEDFLIKTRTATNSDELFKLLSSALRKFGYDRINFSVMRDHVLSKEQSGLGIYQNYPQDWQNHYAEKCYEAIDPVIQYGAAATRPFTWAAMEQRMALTLPQKNLMREGEDAGLNNGVAIPLHGGRLQAAGFALATTERKDACHPHLDTLYAYCSQFYFAFKGLHWDEEGRRNKLVITPREQEILNWMSAGKSNPEIAIILGVSPTTVTTHTTHIFHKLGVHDRTTCIVKAIMHGFVTPYTIPL